MIAPSSVTMKSYSQCQECVYVFQTNVKQCKSSLVATKYPVHFLLFIVWLKCEPVSEYRIRSSSSHLYMQLSFLTTHGFELPLT